MSSVEIVEVINAMRTPGSAELAHSDFLKKVREHPGINEGNFSGIYSDPLGRSKPCYYLPKREAELMVMSESLAVQTQVYDRLAVLEATPARRAKLGTSPFRQTMLLDRTIALL